MIQNYNAERVKIHDVFYENILLILILIKRLDMYISANNGYVSNINGFYFIIVIGTVISSIFTLILFDRDYCKKFIYHVTVPFTVYIIFNNNQMVNERIFPIASFLHIGFSIIYFICLNRFIL
jgi:hypothetical protein